MKGKKLLGLSLAAGTAVAAAAISKKRNGRIHSVRHSAAALDSFNVQNVLSEFDELAKIPRKSGHEFKAAEHLCRWAEKHGLIYVKDSAGNVIIDKPASHGYENSKRVILQAHMDMVCVADEGVAYDPLHDSIKTVYVPELGTLSAKGTSLGADDGIGIAEILYILKRRDLKHPPLRAIFTVDEEDGMDGAISLDEKYLDAGFLINIDNEDINSLCNACADCSTHVLKSNFVPSEPAGDCAFEISVSGLRGGHSGTDINLGRANAVSLLSTILKKVSESVSFALGSVNGGEAGNAIPKNARAVVITDFTNAPSLKNCFNSVSKRMSSAYCRTEPKLKLSCTELDYVPTPVIPADAADRLFNLISILPCGVNTMSPLYDSFVESSSNIGILKTSDIGFELTVTTRSSVDAHSEKLCLAVRTAAELAGFSCSKTSYAPGWELNPDSVLVREYSKAFKTVTGRNVKTQPLHAGLECGCFARKNPNLDMISIGPTILDIHTPKETLYIKSVTENTKAIISVLEKL